MVVRCDQNVHIYVYCVVWTTHARPSMCADAVSACCQHAFCTRMWVLILILIMWCDQTLDCGNSMQKTAHCLCVLCHMEEVVTHKRQFFYKVLSPAKLLCGHCTSSNMAHRDTTTMGVLETPLIHSVSCKPDQRESSPTSAHTGTHRPLFKNHMCISSNAASQSVKLGL